VTFTLSKKTLRLWQLRTAVITLILSVLLILWTGKVQYLWILPVAIILLGVTGIFIYLPLYHRAWRLTADKNAVEVQSGVIIRVNRIMPYPRMIYAECYATPIGGLLGLEGMVLKAARTKLFLPELKKQETQKIIQIINSDE
jgi:membrane protein YdbS with pleckstrin-like domain